MKTMKRIFVVLIVLALIAASSTAEDRPLYLLWDLPFGCEAYSISDYLMTVREVGSVTNHSHSATDLRPAYTSIKTNEDSHLTLYGFPCDFCYDEWPEPGVYTLKAKISGTNKERSMGMLAVIQAFQEKYGAPDAMSTETATGVKLIDGGDFTLLDGERLYIKCYNVRLIAEYGDPATVKIEFFGQETDIPGMPGVDGF